MKWNSADITLDYKVAASEQTVFWNPMISLLLVCSSSQRNNYMWILSKLTYFQSRKCCFIVHIVSMSYRERWVITMMLHELHGASDHRPLDYVFNISFGLTPNKQQRPALLDLREGNLAVTVGFPSQRSTNVESVSISWHHHVNRRVVFAYTFFDHDGHVDTNGGCLLLMNGDCHCLL